KRVPSGNTFDVTHVFAPMLVQYAQIDLLASAPTPWMISEILVHPAVTWNATASHNARAACRAIDNRTETAWTSDAPQTPGMWFQLDLGRVETVSGLTLITPHNEHPAGFRIALWNASANRWQVVCERVNNRAQVEVMFPAQPTQFINIQLTQASRLPWAIQHVHVAREMEDWLGPGKI
ncbi:MAG: discoidin domain-containing protein, partial [Anaerolineae bacterium]|nr:discoidin domain-containing protein [Anaerolineae bacterium]